MTVSILHPAPKVHEPALPADDGAVVLLNPHAVPDGAEVLGVLVRLPAGPVGGVPAGRSALPEPSWHRSPVSPAPEGIQIHHGLVLDERSRLVHSHGLPLPLTRLEFDLLHYFATHPGRVLTRDNLLTAVWDRDPAWASSRTVDVHVLRLRRALGPAHAEALQTVRGVGYRWVP